MKIQKRNGNLIEFDKSRMFNAVKKAFDSCDYDIDDESIEDIISEVQIWDEINVEDIQDQIEELLMDYGYNDVAKEYILYRKDRAIIRANKDIMTAKIAEKLSAKNVANQNANVDETSFGGRKGEALRVVTKDYALKYCMSTKSAENHLNNRIYIHDLDSYADGEHNCLSVPFDDLLKNGFTVKNSDIRPASSVSTALQLVAVIFQTQSLCQFGGVSATHLDWTMVPYVRKSFNKHVCNYIHLVLNKFVSEYSDNPEFQMYSFNPTDYSFDQLKEFLDPDLYRYAYKLTEKELYQGVEALYHNLNTLLSRSGDQLPFSSINYGTCTLPEGRMVIKALLDCSIEGIGKYHRTSIFPCGIFQLMSGVNKEPGTPNYDLKLLALKSTAKRIYPNYANVDWSGNAGYDRNDPRTYFSTMGCRTANGWDVNGFGQLKDGRGNICPVTIIMPTIAMEANGNVNKFISILTEAINDAKDMLLERFEWICSQSPDSAKFMYQNNTMAGYVPEEGIRSALKHGTLAIGNLGLAETLQLLIGKDHTTPEGMELAKRIYSLFRTKCDEFKKEYSLNFGVYNTPAENLCHTALKKFREKYGVIENVSDRDYFTNSMHVPVWKNIDVFTKIDIESQLTGYSNAGCITYVELSSTVNHNIEALEVIVDYAMNKDIPYFAINIPVDDCQNCGASGEFGETCPECGSSNITRLRRVTGYLSSDYRNFNKGKQAEVLDRVKHA